MEHLPPVGWADVATKHDLDHLDQKLEGLLSSMAKETENLGDRLRAEWNRALLQQTYVLVTAMFSLAGVMIAAVKLLS